MWLHFSVSQFNPKPVLSPGFRLHWIQGQKEGAGVKKIKGGGSERRTEECHPSSCAGVYSQFCYHCLLICNDQVVFLKQCQVTHTPFQALVNQDV